MNIIAAAHTDMGCRSVNQDAYSYCIFGTAEKKAVFAVLCDGAGGLNQGELASGEVVRAFEQWISSNMQLLWTMQRSESEIFSRWQAVLSRVNQQIFDLSKREMCQIGTTVAVYLAIDGVYYVMSVGDSRVYISHDRDIKQVTRDHTLVQWEVEQKRITKTQAESDKRRNILLRCVGTHESTEGDCVSGALQRNSFVLLCSDGFYHDADPQKLFEQLAAKKSLNAGELREALQASSAQAKLQGERDNISGILIYSILAKDEYTLDLSEPVQIFEKRNYYM